MMDSEYLGQNIDVTLGQDFLTWLWYKSEVQQGSFTSRQGQRFEAHMEQRISVQGGEGDSLETATVSGAMSEFKEARLGLSTGKKVTRALLCLEKDSIAWQVSLRAEDFSLNSMKLPKLEKPEDDEDPDALLLERLYLIEGCLELLDELYATFLELRLSSTWEEETRKVRSWLLSSAE